MRTLTSLGTLACVTLFVATLGVARPTQSQTPQAQAAPPAPPAVKVGDRAPDFTLPYLDPPQGEPPRYQNKQATLSDFRGKKNVVLAFFPAAFSPG